MRGAVGATPLWRYRGRRGGECNARGGGEQWDGGVDERWLRWEGLIDGADLNLRLEMSGGDRGDDEGDDVMVA